MSLQSGWRAVPLFPPALALFLARESAQRVAWAAVPMLMQFLHEDGTSEGVFPVRSAAAMLCF